METIVMVALIIALTPIWIPIFIVCAIYAWLAAYIIIGGTLMVIRVVVKGIVAYLMDVLGIMWDLKVIYVPLIIFVVIFIVMGG